MNLKHYCNKNVKYVKALFKNHNIKKAEGLLVVQSNGGYKTYTDSPEFGYRIYFNGKTNTLNVQLISEISKKLGHEFIREYSVPLEGMGYLEKADHVQNAILYKEYCDRVVLNKRKAIE